MKRATKAKAETPTTVAPAAAEAAVTETAASPIPTGASLIRQFKSQGMTLKDAFELAAKLNPALKLSSFRVSWYKKETPTGTAVKAKRGRKPGSKNKVAAAPAKIAAAAPASTAPKLAASGSLSDSTKSFVVDALKAKIAELERAVKELGG